MSDTWKMETTKPATDRTTRRREAKAARRDVATLIAEELAAYEG